MTKNKDLSVSTHPYFVWFCLQKLCYSVLQYSTLGRGSSTSENGSVRSPLSEVITELIYCRLLYN